MSIHCNILETAVSHTYAIASRTTYYFHYNYNNCIKHRYKLFTVGGFFPTKLTLVMKYRHIRLTYLKTFYNERKRGLVASMFVNKTQL